MKIAILGGGNIGSSMAEGMIRGGIVPPQELTITRRRTDLLEDLKNKGVQVHDDNSKAVSTSEIVIITVQPQHLSDLLRQIQPALDPKRHLLVSVVTGIGLAEIQDMVGNEIPLFRAMPNIAIAIQESMTCLSTNNASTEQQEQVLAIFAKLGRATFIQDELMQAATVGAACGIAYSLRYIRAASQGGIEIGFDAETAQLIAAQTVKGAASLLIEKGYHPEQEIDRVTTPKGCTIAGLNEMEHQGFSSALIKGIMTSYKKIAQIVGGIH